MSRALTLSTIAVLAAVFALLGMTGDAFAASGVTLVSESFTDATTASSNWFLPGPGLGDPANKACLTAGTASAPIVPCVPAHDSAGSGALQLTGTSGGLGGVVWGTSVPSSEGLDATFTAYQYDSGGSAIAADGLSFFLAAANPADPTPPSTLGYFGGGLGYAAVPSYNYGGLPDGYLGFGFDVYGGYESSTYENTACPSVSIAGGAEQVSVRGPGEGTTGYCELKGTGPLGSGALDNPTATSRSGNGVPVEVVVNPAGSAVTTDSGLNVAADSWEIAFKPLGGTQKILTAALPNASGDGIPSAWLNSSGVPYQITFGWAGSSATYIEYHQITDATVSTLSGSPATFALAVGDDASHAPVDGSTMTSGVTASNASSASADPGPVSVTDTVPSGDTPQSSGLGGTGWSCAIASQTVTCTYAGSASAASSLPQLSIPVLVGSTAGTATSDKAVVSSDTGVPATAQDSATATAAPKTTTTSTSTTTSTTSTTPTASTTTTTAASPATTATTAIAKTAAPTAVTAPKLSGTAKAGKTLTCSTGIWSNSPSGYGYQWSRDGTPLIGAASRTYTVQTLDEGSTLTCAVTARNGGGAATVVSKGLAVAVPVIKGCPAATGSLSAQRIGLARLGMTRAQVQRVYTHSSTRGTSAEDFFCLTPIGIRVGLASAKLVHTLSRTEAAGVRGRVIWISTSNPRYAIDGIRPGATLTAAKKVLAGGTVWVIGKNTWYLRRTAKTTVVLKVRGGVVEEVGITERALTATHAAQKALLTSFD